MTADRSSATPLTTEEIDLAKDSMLGDRFMIRFSEDTLKHRPLSIRLIVEFVGTFILVTVAAGSGVINHYVGSGPISRTAAVIAPGAVVMAMIYALGPLSGLHINPAVTLAFTARRVFKAIWAVPYIIVQFAGAIAAALFLQTMYGHVTSGGNYPINKPGGEWRIARDGDRCSPPSWSPSFSTRRPATAASATTRRSPSARRWRSSGSSPARSAAPR